MKTKLRNLIAQKLYGFQYKELPKWCRDNVDEFVGEILKVIK